MKPFARTASTLAALVLLPVLQALCPRLAPDVISGKVIPCRYLCIKINFFEMPSIILSTEKDGALCSTLLLRRRGVCKQGGCVPFESDEESKPKGTIKKMIVAIDRFASGSFKKKVPESSTPFGPIVTTGTSNGGGSGSTTQGGTGRANNPNSSPTSGDLVKTVGLAISSMLSGASSRGTKSGSPGTRPFSNAPSQRSNGVSSVSPPIVPPSLSTGPQKESSGISVTNNARGIVLSSPPIEAPSNEANGNGGSQIPETPRRSSTSEGRSVRGLFGMFGRR